MSAYLRSAARALAESALFKNSLALISGTVATQAIVFLFSPFLSRIYGLSDFGNLANFNAWVAILAVVSNLRYEHAVIVAKGPEKTNRLIALSASLSLASCALYELVALGLYFGYSGAGYLRDLKDVVLFVPIGVLAVCASSLLIQFNVKTGRFRRLATVATVQVVLTITPQIVLGYIHVANALIIGTISGYVASGIIFATLFVREHGANAVRQELVPRWLWEAAQEHRNFPRYTLAADAIGVAVQQFVPVFILALYNPAVAGLYAFSIRVVRVPLIVISTAVSGALRKEAIDQVHADSSLAGLYRLTVRTLLLLAVLPFLAILFYGRQIFAFVFGAQWIEAGRVVQILSPGIVLEFVALPMAAFFLVTNTQRFTLIIQLSGFILMIGALVLGRHLFGRFEETCYLIAIAMVAVNVAAIALAAKVTGTRPAEAVPLS